MNVFDTHEKIIADYASYIKSFINIADHAIDDFELRGERIHEAEFVI